MTRETYKEREKRRREDEILHEARRLIHENGYANLNMDQLAEAVGISKPTLYQHFRNKEDLIARVMVNGIGEVEDYLLSTTEESPLERLKIGLRLLLLSRYAAGGQLADFEAEVVMSSFHGHPDVVAAKRRVMAEACRVVDEGKTRGEIIPTIPTQLVGCYIFRLIGLPATLEELMSSEARRPLDEDALNILLDNVIGMFARSIALHQSSN